MLRSAARHYSSTTAAAGATKRNPRFTVHIRPWDIISSPADVLIIARHIEQKYGRLREFKCFRDYEMPGTYQYLMFASFRNPESQPSIPTDGEVVRVEAPALTEAPDTGGPGLDEIYATFENKYKLVENTEKSADELQRAAAKAGKRVISFRIQPAKTHLTTPAYGNIPRPTFTHTRQQRFGVAFLSWAGFAPLEKIKLEDMRFTSDADPGLKDSHRRFQLRRALFRWSRFTGRPDPAVDYGEDQPAQPQLSGQTWRKQGVPVHTTLRPPSIETNSESLSFSPPSLSPMPSRTPPPTEWDALPVPKPTTSSLEPDDAVIDDPLLPLMQSTAQDQIPSTPINLPPDIDALSPSPILQSPSPPAPPDKNSNSDSSVATMLQKPLGSRSKPFQQPTPKSKGKKSKGHVSPKVHGKDAQLSRKSQSKQAETADPLTLGSRLKQLMGGLF